MLFLMPKQQCQNTDGKFLWLVTVCANNELYVFLSSLKGSDSEHKGALSFR